VVKVEGLIPAEVTAPLRGYVYARLAKAGLRQNDVWAASMPWSEMKEALLGSNRSATFARLLTPEVLGAAAELAGEAVQATAPPLQLLFTPPGAGAWEVPYNVWHLDVPRLGDLGAPGVQVFTFVHEVAAHGGGTLVVAGSHRLLNDDGVIRSKTVKQRLKRHPFFRDLMDKRAADRARFMECGEAGGVPVQVVELTGSPGDVYFTDLRMLHSLGPNTSPVPRLMVTQRFLRAAIAARMFEAHAEAAAAQPRVVPAEPALRRTSWG